MLHGNHELILIYSMQNVLLKHAFVALLYYQYEYINECVVDIAQT